MKAVALHAWGLTDVAATYEALGLKRTNDEQEALVALVINAATADIELFCARRLKSRSYAIGASPLRVRGDGSIRIVVPEYPLTAVTAIRWRERQIATWHNLDLSGIDFMGNWIEVPNDAVPYGSMAEITCDAGYKAGFDSDHDAKLASLEIQCLRLVQIKWTDIDKKVGRKLVAQTTRGDQVLESTELPKDMQIALFPFRRV